MSRGIAALVALVALAVTGSLSAATTDPIIGTWRVTRGGSGTIAIKRTPSFLAFVAKTSVKLGCVTGAPRDIVGFAELPSRTRLPKGRYNGNFGGAGQGCYYVVPLKLTGGTLTGKVAYSENDEPGGPFALTRVPSR